MSRVDNILSWVGLARKADVGRRLSAAYRSFEGAIKNNLTSDWHEELKSINDDVRESSQRLTIRAHDLFKNNAYARRFVDLFRMNVVGPDGFNLQVKSGEHQRTAEGKVQFVTDDVANSMIEDRFTDWSKPEHCSVDGTLSFRAIQDLLALYTARDGEYLVRKVYNGSKYGFQLQILEPHLLDHQLNKDLPNGNFIRMGIELDVWRKPVAYHLMKRTPKFESWGSTYYQVGHDRIPAEEIYHGFLHEWAFQYRGYSRLAPVMLHLRFLKAWEIAAVVNARLTAERPGWFKAPSSGDGKFPVVDQDAAGNPTIPSSIGEWGKLPAGWEITKPESDYPHPQHEMFIRSSLRGISSGLGVSYNMLANDLVGVNYSSIRAGLLDEREQWKGWQRWFIESFLVKVFADQLEMAILTGQVKLPISKLEKYNRPVWTGRRWAWVDPLRDVEAELLQRQAGFKSSTQIIAERGRDFEELMQQLGYEDDYIDKLGLNLKINEVKPSSGTSTPVDEGKPADDDGSGSDGKKQGKKAIDILNTVRKILMETPVRTNGDH